MKYTEKEFSQCVFNPLVKEGMLDVYPQLNEIISPELAQDRNLDKILRYVICVYDPKSPLVFQIKDLNHRKGNATDLIEFKLDEEELIKVYSGENESVFEVTARYLARFAKSKEFAALCSLEYKFWESIRKLMTPVDEDNANAELQAIQKKSIIAEEIDKDIKRIDAYWEMFFGDKDMVQQVAKKRYGPEDIGKMRLNV